jgi:hypothetical protein
MKSMVYRETINQYDLVEIVQVPQGHTGAIHPGDVGVVIEKYNERSFEVECLRPGGLYEWQARLSIQHIKLKSRDPYNAWIKKSLVDRPMMRKSLVLGTVLGIVFGALIGAGFGAITRSLNGILIGLIAGLLLGAVTGVLTAALTVRIAGMTGGVGVGYFTGMIFGGAFGTLVGALIPTSLRMSAVTEGLPVLDALVIGRFETAILTGFLHSILATIIGVWVGGKNLAPRNLQERNHS